MQIIRNITNFKATIQNHIVTIGNYDGIHLGHQEILKKVKSLATATGLPNILITFEPHPREYFHKHSLPHYRLMTWREKISILKNYAINTILILRFNATFAQLSPEDFITKILVDKLHTKYLVVGENFRFGNKNSGDINLLQKYSQKLDFQLIPVPIYSIDNHQVSSSLIRQMLKNDALITAKKLLGRHYSVLGRVIHGDKRGRDLGFPTANIHLAHNIIPLAGVYAVKVYNIYAQPIYGIANIGFRPTINDKKRLLEVHLFDFNQDIYGKIIKVEFIYKLRNEKKFANFTLLQQQIQQDLVTAQKYFATCA
jgi:riboflavin kinase / FMN adenylyltransferase